MPESESLALNLAAPLPTVSSMAMIAEVVRVSPRAALVVLDLQNRAFSFLPGQAVLVGVPGQARRRPFSIACSPEHAAVSRRIDLLVGTEPGETQGRLPLQPGTTLEVEGPVGTFTLPSGLAHRRVLFVAGGTGIAPVRSMLDHARRRHASTTLALLYSARSADELVFLHEWRALAAVGRIALHSTITGTDVRWTGARGRLGARQFGAYLGDPLDTLCFVCGPASFVRDGVAALVDLGVPREAVRTEQWCVMPDVAVG